MKIDNVMDILLCEAVDFFLEKVCRVGPDNEAIADREDESRSKIMVIMMVVDGSCTI